MASKTIGEIFDMVEQAKTKKEKAAVFYANSNNMSLIKFFQIYRDPTPWVYESRPIPKITTDDPPHGYAENTIANCLRRLYLFREGSNTPEKKQDEQFIQVVESLGETEAMILIAMVRGEKLPFKMITRKFIDDLFDGKI